MSGLVNVDIGGIISGIGSTAKDLRQAFTGEVSAEKKAELEAKVLEIEQQAMTAQAQINQEEARSTSQFVSGWRPFIGWICGGALAFQFIVRPLLLWGFALAKKAIELPALDMSELYPLVISLLGLGVYRTAEKIKGVQDRH